MLKHFFKKFANLKIAISILFSIAITSSIGSIIEQNKDIIFYKENYSNNIFGISYWEIIFIAGLNDIYNTWWFLSLIFFLGLSLICCTVLQQLPTLRFSKKYYFYKRSTQFNKLAFKENGSKIFHSYLSYNLINNEYSLFRQYNNIYAYKGLISRIGPIIVHLSIICILAGSTVGSLNGFNSQEIIAKTELFHIQNIIKHGFFSSISQKSFRVNDFWAIYKENGLIKQFYSDISILNSNGAETKRKTISVNNPLLLNNNILLYQTDWGILGLRVKIIDKENSNYIFQLPISKINTSSSKKIWISWLPTTSNKNIIIIKDIRGQLSLYNKQGKFIKDINLGQKIDLTKLLTFNILDFIVSSGIQIKSDPGIKVIYLGFFTLIISSLVSYISFSEFWLLVSDKHIVIGGKTNRAKVKYNLEFIKFNQSFIK